MDDKGDHVERYLSIVQHHGEIQITSSFFADVLNYFNYGCDGCVHGKHKAIDITRIMDNGEQIYCDVKEKE